MPKLIQNPINELTTTINNFFGATGVFGSIASETTTILDFPISADFLSWLPYILPDMHHRFAYLDPFHAVTSHIPAA